MNADADAFEVGDETEVAAVVAWVCLLGWVLCLGWCFSLSVVLVGCSNLFEHLVNRHIVGACVVLHLLGSSNFVLRLVDLMSNQVFRGSDIFVKNSFQVPDALVRCHCYFFSEDFEEVFD